MLMKTKQILTLSTLATLLMASCSKDNITSVNPGDAIRVNAFVNAASKATEVTSSNFNQFKLYGFAQTSYASNFEDTYSQSGSSWTAALGKHYWPSSPTETMNFLAHYPTDLSTAFVDPPTLNFASLGAQAIPSTPSVAGVKPKVHAKDQVDFLISRNMNINSQTAATSGGVSLLFKHALTQVAVTAKCSNPNMIVKVKGVKLGNYATNRTINYPANTITTGTNPLGDNIWQTGTSSDLASYMAGGTAADYTTVTLNSNQYQDITSGQNFMIIPQMSPTAWTPSSSNGGAYIAVLCQIYQGSESPENLLFPSSADKWGFAAVGIGNNLPISKKTTINLEFFGANGGGAGNIPPDKTDPSVPTDPSIDTDTGSEGDPVVGGTINFSVSVTGWEDGFASVENGGQLPMPN